MIRRRYPDIALLCLLFLLPLVMFWQQTVGGYTLLPTENLYQYEPFATYRDLVHAPAVPHNALLSDLVLENYQWKSFILDSLHQHEIPLWNPHQFAGIPFLASGQQSTFYPLSVLYYVLPLTAAYGWFTVVNLWLAGAFMYALLRGLGVGRLGGAIAGIVYQLSAFMVTSAVFPMILGAAVWLPLLLLMAEYVIRQQPLFGRPASVPWVAIGAVALGCNLLAGHVELTYYTLIILAYYAAARLIGEWWTKRKSAVGAQHAAPLHTSNMNWFSARAGWLGVMVALGVGLGAIQFLPLLELVRTNWRSDSATFQQVLSYAHPLRDGVQFVMPNFYGNPTHHSYFDVFTMQTVTQFTNLKGDPITTIDWGIKNYVEGALYLGILPLVLAVYALVHGWQQHRGSKGGSETRPYTPPYWGIFGVLVVVSLTFMFGLPTYALLYYGFPGLNQSHTPFRWIYAVTLGVAVLAGFGVEALAGLHRSESDEAVRAKHASPLQNRIARLFGYALIIAGVGILAALLLSRVFYAQIEPLLTRLVSSMALADQAFSDARMFYSYQFTNVLTFGLFTLGAGVVFWLAGRNSQNKSLARDGLRPSPTDHIWGYGWQILAVALVALDLLVASWGFNPASNPALLDFTPPAIQWLQQQPGKWRYMTLDDPLQRPIMQANVGIHYGLDDVRGYESIIPKQYVDFMGQLEPPVQLDYNRIAPLYTSYPEGTKFNFIDALKSPLLDALNVRYLITHKTTRLDIPQWKLAYEDEAVAIWENAHYRDGFAQRAYITRDPGSGKPDGSGTAVAIMSDTGREQLLNFSTDGNAWLIVSESYFPGWRAFYRPQGGEQKDEKPLDVQLVQGNFQGIKLPEAGSWTVRVVYSPTSFNIGLFGSVISAALVVFLVGVWLWRLFIVPATGEAGSAARVARNSLAPIILNLFNRGIDFAFAFVMLRVLGPENAGIYYYAVFIFGWFDIFTNFGLNTFLTREVARDHSRAGSYLFNTSLLRLALMIAGIGLLLTFIITRQATVSPPLSDEALLAIGLLYIGLLPNSLSTGLSALFYAFEEAEYPAAIATLATICKAAFGIAALVFGYGVVGLAGVSIITNCITLAAMLYTARGLIHGKSKSGSKIDIDETNKGLKPTVEQPVIQRGILRPDWKLMRGMLNEGFPLMLNHFLATIFFQIDVVIIQAVRGDRMVGQYSVAYKWVSALNIIPAFFTMALLPVMSRQAKQDRAALKRNYGLAIKLLVSVALPTALLFTFMAYFLTGILGGSEFLPDGAIATQLMIWSIPIGWMNSLTQYVLIALDLQRRITTAFVVAVAFNIIANSIFIPSYGYQAAAIITIASEAVLLVPFGVLLQSGVGRIGWWGLVWKPLAATLVMLGVMLVGWSLQPLVGLVGGSLVYVAVLLALRPFTSEELALLMPLIPARLRDSRGMRLLFPIKTG